MYYLMNKDKMVALLRIITDTDESKLIETIKTYDRMPIGLKDIDAWVDNRKASKHNAHLQNLMMRMGCHDIEGFIKITHAASINDTFWIKSVDDETTWDQISLYQNQFTETISKLAFEGVGLYDGGFSTTTPEFTCDGSFRKCFRKEPFTGKFNSDIFLYKRGEEYGKGLEPYCEKLASEIAAHISPDNHVPYDLTMLHDKLASRCNLFTNEQQGYASYAKITNAQRLRFSDINKYYESIGSEDTFREMLVIDALCFNEDRHAGNYGVIFDTDTLEIKRMAPVFDLNISFFRNATPDDFSHMGDTIYKTKPKIGDDFTRIGQIAMTDKLRDRVKDLCDFKFSFRGDDTFSPERVKMLEKIVQKQANALLSKDKLLTTDVFFSQEAQTAIQQHKEQQKAEKQLNEFLGMLDNTSFDENIVISHCVSTNVVSCYVENENSMITLDFLTKQLSISHNGQHVEIDQLATYDADFIKTYNIVNDKWQAHNNMANKTNPFNNKMFMRVEANSMLSQIKTDEPTTVSDNIDNADDINKK